GNMYKNVTTWNPLGGECYHNCSYCSTNNWKNRFPHINKKYTGPPYLIPNEFKPLGSGKTIFVCSMTDLFAKNVPNDYREQIINHAKLFDNKYIFQTKDPVRTILVNDLPEKSMLGITLETNRHYPAFMHNAPTPYLRAVNFRHHKTVPRFITIEPIMKFDHNEFYNLIHKINPELVYIGADSKGNNLPEPSWLEITDLIIRLEEFTTVIQKDNLKRLLTPTTNT
ncbi:MAG: DUF5131 family protein, partial [Bacteroidales bacterium]